MDQRTRDHQGLRNLSVMKIEQAMLCPLAFRYRYVDRIPELSGGSMLAGRVVHALIEHALNRVLLGQQLTSWKELDDMFDSTWAQEAQDEEKKENFVGWRWDEDDPEEKVKRETRPLVRLAREEVLPGIKPRLVEKRFELTLPSAAGDYTLVGYIDLLETSGVLSDWKTTTKVSARQKSTFFQFAGYSVFVAGLLGVEVVNCQKIFLVRGARPRVEYCGFEMHERHRAFFIQEAAKVWQMVQAEAFVANPNTWACSKDWCSFWAGCMGELHGNGK